MPTANWWVCRPGLRLTRDFPRPRAPVQLLGLPRADRGRVRDGRGARLRRRRGDGLDRRGQPGRRRAARAWPPTTACRCCPCTRPACWSPSGCGAPTRGSGCAAPPSWPRRWARRPSSCTRRSPGSATTRATSPPGLAKLAARHTGHHASRSRTCIPVRMAGREFVPYVPGWDPTEAGYDAYTLDLSHCAASRTDALEMADRMGARPRARAPRRRHRRGPRRAPGARARQPALRRAAAVAGRAGFHRARWRVEVTTRRATSRAVREADLRESLAVRPRITWRPAAPPATPAAQLSGVRAGGYRRGVRRRAARLRARCAATCERVAQRSEQNRRQQLDDVSR